jgi:hypothetical protein
MHSQSSVMGHQQLLMIVPLVQHLGRLHAATKRFSQLQLGRIAA